MCARITHLVSLLALVFCNSIGFSDFAAAAAQQVTIKSNDTVVVESEAAPFYVRGEEFAKLKKGTTLTVLEVRGIWVGGNIVVNGKKQPGWIKNSEVKLAGSPVAPKKAVKPKSPPSGGQGVAALKSLGVEFEQNADGQFVSASAAKSKVTDAALEQLKDLTALEELDLSGTKVTNAGLAHVKQLTSLKRLYLDGTNVSSSGLVHLKLLTNIEVLALHGSKVTDDGMAHLKPLKNLQVLNLSSCPITDASLKHLPGLTKIETLALENTKVKGPGLAHVGKLTNLITLSLGKTEIVGDAMLHLKDLRKLRIIRMYDAKVSDESVEQLEDAVPSLAIFR